MESSLYGQLAIGDRSSLSKVGTASWGNPMPVFLQFCLWISDIMFYRCFYPLMFFCILMDKICVQLIIDDNRYCVTNDRRKPRITMFELSACFLLRMYVVNVLITIVYK
jgi:hypothetical protein